MSAEKVDDQQTLDKEVLLLRPAVQKYDWGVLGSHSKVAYLSHCNNPTVKIEKFRPYAELWMGTHPKGPATLTINDELLSEWIVKNPLALGEHVLENFPSEDGQLPFLFKVLSVQKSLSIQAHPSKEHAKLLHRQDPKNYPDANHKPEMAIALTEFEALCGFRPKSEILKFLLTIEPLQELVGKDLIDKLSHSHSEEDDRKSVKECFKALMQSNPNHVLHQVQTLARHITDLKFQKEPTEHLESDLFIRLHTQFHGDVGCMVIYFLNHIFLQPGQAIFLKANLPHAYIFGDCIECMACSDNVVRAGLTPKFKDVNVLVEMLDYTLSPDDLSGIIFRPYVDPSNPYITLYRPPIMDFAVDRITMPESVKELTLLPYESPSIVLVVMAKGKLACSANEDKGLEIRDGSIFFIRAHQKLYYRSLNTQTLMFRSYCNV